MAKSEAGGQRVGERRNRQRATATNARAKAISAAISSNTSPKSAPNSMSLLKPVLAQPWGVSFARDCIQAGVMKRGHQHPPIGAITSEASTPAESPLRSV